MRHKPKSRTSAKLFLLELQRVAGADAVALLKDSCSGLRVYIPSRPLSRGRGERGHLVRAFGSLDAANAIVEKLNFVGVSGVCIEMPNCRSRRVKDIGIKMQKALLSGHSVAETAEMYGMSQRMVYYHRRKYLKKSPPSQASN